MIYSYKDIITAARYGELTPDNIQQTKFNNGFVCCHTMKLRDLFALWDENSVNNNTVEEFENQLRQSRTTTECAVALTDKQDYTRDPEIETFEENINRRGKGYRSWVLSNFNKQVKVLSITSSENRTVNIAFDCKDNTPMFVRQSAWLNLYKTKFGFLNKHEYPKTLEDIYPEDPEYAIKASHGFSSVTK